MKKLLVVGAVPDEKNKLQYGGATVLTKVLVDFLDAESVDYDFVQTNRFSHVRKGKKDILKSSIWFLAQFLRKIRCADIVMFNFSDHGVVSLFPMLSRFVRKSGKKVVLRKFGGSFDIYLQRVSPARRSRVLHALAECDLILFETRSGIRHLQSLIDADGKIEWFPNVRRRPVGGRTSRLMNRRLAFLSHISNEKGVGDVLKLAEYLCPEYTLDLYGAIKDSRYSGFDWAAHGVTYHGEVSSDAVIDVLKSVQMLLLPSYREGYPGVIIEALSLGVPVLATNVGGIPEMISDGKEGILIAPGDVRSACRRIKELTPEQYAEMSRCALETFEKKFEADSTNRRIIDRILAL